MVGGYALRYALGHPAVATAIVRRKLDISHPKLNQVVHRHFADCAALAETLSGQDRSGLLPGRIYQSGVGRETPDDNR